MNQVLRFHWLAAMLCISFVTGARAAGRSSIDASAPLFAAAAKALLPPPAPLEPRVYRLSPGDRIEVKVFQQPDMTTNDRLGTDGQIPLPLLGRVKLGGLTEDQAKALVFSLYEKDYFVHPQISLTVAERGKWKFTVSGQVARPGTYDAANGEVIDLLEAISRAGDFNGKSKKSDVQVIRKDQPPIHKNAEDLMRGKEPPFEIIPGDQILVNERLI